MHAELITALVDDRVRELRSLSPAPRRRTSWWPARRSPSEGELVRAAREQQVPAVVAVPAPVGHQVAGLPAHLGRERGEPAGAPAVDAVDLGFGLEPGRAPVSVVAHEGELADCCPA